MNESLQDRLASFGQSHLLYGIDDLDESTRSAYLDALEQLDLPYLNQLFRAADTSPTLGGTISPAPSVSVQSFSDAEAAVLTERGCALIHDGAVAVVTMAGGQGTRLGYAGPKGCFDVGIGTSLFGLLAARIRKLEAETGGVIPWYLMTSVENEQQTLAFFKENAFFGLSEQQVFFFKQAVLPLMDTSGRILLADRGRIAEGPDGNGGVFAALHASGALVDMARRGVVHVFFCGIDNALAKPADPLFVGFFDRDGAPCASKSVCKGAPDERVGVFCQRDGKPCVIEYTELTPEMRSAVDASGAWLYGDANIVTHILRLDAVQSICQLGLPMHTAHKAIPFWDPHSDQQVRPTAPNALKFESFIFDAFHALERMAILQVERTREFAPVKNASGADSPATALALLQANGY